MKGAIRIKPVEGPSAPPPSVSSRHRHSRPATATATVSLATVTLVPPSSVSSHPANPVLPSPIPSHPRQSRPTNVSNVASGGHANRTGVYRFVPHPADTCMYDVRPEAVSLCMCSPFTRSVSRSQLVTKAP